MWTSTTLPDNNQWKICNGESLNRSDYPELFEIIGTTFGNDDGLTFKIPNLDDVFIKSSTTTINSSVSGNNNITLSTNQLPSHNHNASAGNQSANHSHTVNLGDQSANHSHTVDLGDQSANHSHTANTNSRGHQHRSNLYIGIVMDI